MPNELNFFKVHFYYNTKASIWLPPQLAEKDICNQIEIPAKSIILATQGGLAFDGTLILDIRVPLRDGIGKIGLHVSAPNSGNINFFAKEESGYKVFDVDPLVHSLMYK